MCASDAESSLYALACRFVEELNASRPAPADSLELHPPQTIMRNLPSFAPLARELKRYELVTRSLVHPKPEPTLTSVLDCDEGEITFAVNTSGLPGGDFYITATRDGRVFYSDGMGENDVQLWPQGRTE